MFAINFILNINTLVLEVKILVMFFSEFYVCMYLGTVTFDFFNQSPFVQILLKKRQTDKKTTKKHLSLPLAAVSEVMTEVAASRKPDELGFECT